jgi:hypothetical protein
MKCEYVKEIEKNFPELFEPREEYSEEPVLFTRGGQSYIIGVLRNIYSFLIEDNASRILVHLSSNFVGDLNKITNYMIPRLEQHYNLELVDTKIALTSTTFEGDMEYNFSEVLIFKRTNQIER